MRIGELAAAAEVPTLTIRFYERIGLLSPPRRGPNGHRLYDAPTATRLEFIRSAQGARLTLVEIATILELRDEGATPYAHVQELLATKLLDVQTQRHELAGARYRPAGTRQSQAIASIQPTAPTPRSATSSPLPVAETHPVEPAHSDKTVTARLDVCQPCMSEAQGPCLELITGRPR